MATRALVGYFDNDDKKFIATYNHYDGYPSNLGVGLETHYNTPEKAMEIASKGYISYLNPETGEIESKNEDKPEVIDINTDWETAIVSIAETIQSFGVNYAYIYSPENMEWVNIKYSNITSTLEDLFQAFAPYAGDFDYSDEEYNQMDASPEDDDQISEYKKMQKLAGIITKTQPQLNEGALLSIIKPSGEFKEAVIALENYLDTTGGEFDYDKLASLIIDIKNAGASEGY